ncbi:MAG: hypothetical protein JSS49_03590 [Planctomycetes bacterium]|nr:hypothetical protein [Planctomycetota bacterium]
MYAVFHGWRRKAGCGTLVMALAVMSGWIRSGSIRDQVIFPYADFETVSLISFDRSLLWGRHHDERFKSTIKLPVCANSPLGTTFVSFFDNESGVEWYWQWCGFGVGEVRHKTMRDLLKFWIIPYWSIVSPLTLLSAYLILWPGKRKANKLIQNSTTSTSNLQS